jgi:uncharacterized protein YecE (DUF72 family)
VEQNLLLFEADALPLKEHLRTTLKRLADFKLFLGTSSWKYEDWLGSLYSPQRYFSGRRFSKSRFERECLREYTEVFRVVSGDFAFYQFPTAAFWKDLFAQVQSPFQFAFKAPEEITAPAFPNHPRYGSRAGSANVSFLDSVMFAQQFLEPLRPYLECVGVIIFEFPASSGKIFTGEQFADVLAQFLKRIPKQFRYAVEIRSPSLFCAEYFRTLREEGVAHVFNSWTEMIPVGQQMSEPDAFTADFTASRALTALGRSYEESVRLFKPYTCVREPNAEVRQALRNLLVRSKQRGEPAYIFVNNRLEGFSPGTIAAVADDIGV